MKDTSGIDLFLAIIAAVAFLLAGIGIGTSRMRARAIGADVARWEVDPSTGKTKFVFVK